MIVFVLKINMYKIWIEPVIEERFDTNRTILTLEFIEKQAKKTGEESKRRKTSDTITKIYEYFAQYDEAKTKDIAEYIAPNNEKIS